MSEDFIEVKESLIDMYNFNKHIKVELRPCGAKAILDYIDSKDKEIERLNNKIKEQSLLLIEFQDMEQRLKEKDDIINKFEEWLIQETIDLYDKDNPLLLDVSFTKYATERKMAYMYVLDKLKELKGSDKNDNL